MLELLKMLYRATGFLFILVESAARNHVSPVVAIDAHHVEAQIIANTIKYTPETEKVLI